MAAGKAAIIERSGRQRHDSNRAASTISARKKIEQQNGVKQKRNVSIYQHIISHQDNQQVYRRVANDAARWRRRIVLIGERSSWRMMTPLRRLRRSGANDEINIVARVS